MGAGRGMNILLNKIGLGSVPILSHERFMPAPFPKMYKVELRLQWALNYSG
jgi:hypothetical protein